LAPEASSSVVQSYLYCHLSHYLLYVSSRQELQLLLITANRSSMLIGLEACEGVHFCGRALLSHSQADANWMAQGTAVIENSER